MSKKNSAKQESLYYSILKRKVKKGEYTQKDINDKFKLYNMVKDSPVSSGHMIPSVARNKSTPD